MNAERLLEHFDRVADAPDAVPRLRRFVLDLAVRGKLVEQDPTDEPASELLKRIATVRKLVPPSGRSIKNVSIGSSLNEVTYTLPEGWGTTKLSHLVRVLNGRAYKKVELLNSGTPVLRVGNLFTSKHWYYSNLELEQDKYCDDGDLIYAWSASFGPFIWKGPRVIYHYHIWKLSLFDEDNFDKRYLYFFLLQKTQEIKSASHGVSMVHMTKRKMEQLAVSVPPLAEQRRIVARVDELMALCDRLEETHATYGDILDRLTNSSYARLSVSDADSVAFRSRARFAVYNLPVLTTRVDQIKYLRQIVLNLAVRGKLVKQDPEDEPPPRFDPTIPNDLEAPFPVPPNWRWSRLSALGVLKGGGTPSRARSDYWNGPIPWVSPKDMKVDYIAKTQLNISEAAIKGSAVKLIEAKSILFVVRGMILAHSFPVAISCVPVTINQDMKAITLKNPEIAEYLLLALKGLKLQVLERVKRSSHGTCRIESRDYRHLMIPLPPLAEQHRIVTKVGELMALFNRLEVNLNAVGNKRLLFIESLLLDRLIPEVKDTVVTVG